MILAKLKEATREQHDALETVVDVMNKTFTTDDYKGLLKKFYRYYSAIEPTLPAAHLLAEGFDIEQRRKKPLLEKDLEALGTLAEAQGLAQWTDVPNVRSVASAFGSIYVMEGATLGGQVITRQLKQNLGITPDSGGAFFNSYGANVGPMWKEFGAAVTAFAERQKDADDEIIQAAKDTFDSFRRCFEASAAASN